MKQVTPLVAVSESDEMFSTLYSAVIDMRGYRSVCFPDKSDLLKAMPYLKPDLVITDIEAVGMDGIEFLSLVKASPEMERVPILVISSESSFFDAALSLGAWRFLSKPVEVETLLETIDQAITKSPWAAKGRE